MDTRPSRCDNSLQLLARWNSIHTYKTFSLAKRLENALHHFSLLGIRCLRLLPSHISRAALHLHFEWWLSGRRGAEPEVVYSHPEPVPTPLPGLAVSLLLPQPAWCPRRSPLGQTLALGHSVKEQINPRGICMTGWEDCVYVTRPWRDFWFPSPCASVSSQFGVGVDRHVSQPFLSSLRPSLASAQGQRSRAGWTGPQHALATPWVVTGAGPWAHESTPAGKTAGGKNGLPPKTRHTDSLVTFENADAAFHANFVLPLFHNCFSRNGWSLFFLLLLCIPTLILQPGYFPLISQLLSAIGFLRYHREFKIFSIKILRGCSC